MRQLEWLTALAAVLLVGLVEVGHRLAQSASVGDTQILIVELAGTAIAVFIVVRAFERRMHRMQAALALRGRELLALHDAGLAITRELDLDAVLQLIVERARELVGARYGALSLLDPGGRLDLFITSGISEQQRSEIGAPPSGHGLLAVPLREGQRLRIADISADTRSVGFPAHHPAMKSLLAVPILSNHGVLGNL